MLTFDKMFLFDQKSPALWVPVTEERDRQLTDNKHTDIANYRPNQPRGQFGENQMVSKTICHVKL